MGFFPPPFPFHQGGATDQNANLLQRFNDSEFGVVLATFLHTFGALLFTSGIFLYIYQARLVRQAHVHRSQPNLRLLPFAQGLTLVGISLNGLGGLMRLYESDHPHIDKLGSSLWVQVLFVKHLFLLLGVGVAAYLTYRTHVLSQADDAPAGFVRETNRVTTFALMSFGTIILASILGAVATSQPLPMDAETGAAGDTMDHTAMPAASGVQYRNSTGLISGTPVMEGRATSDLPAPEGTTELYAEVTWSDTQAAVLDASLSDPTGAMVAAEHAASAGRVTLTWKGAIPTGNWRIIVTSKQAVDEAYLVIGRATVGTAPHASEQTCNLPARSAQGRNGAAEVNFDIQLHQRFNFTWQIMNDPTKVAFNIHVHVAGNVVNKVDGTWNRLSGDYVHDEPRVNTTSLYWENPTSVALKVHYRITGDFAYLPDSAC